MNKEISRLTCLYMNESGKGIVRSGASRVAISNLITDEIADIELYHTKNGLNGKLLKVIEASKDRTIPKCKYFKECGACQLQHLTYEGQKKFKQDTVKLLLEKYVKVNEIIGMENPYNYRNKIHASFKSIRKDKVISGIYEENTHNIIPIEKCIIQDSRADDILATIRKLMVDFKVRSYDEETNMGLIKHVLIKIGIKTNQVMVVLVSASPIFPSKNNFVKVLVAKHPEIKTIILNINNRRTSMVLGNIEKVLYGPGFIEDVLSDFKFQISAKSFYQINPIQTEILYKKAIELAKLKGNETVIDTYSGIGTISLILSRSAKKVLAVELNQDAVKDAIQNAKRNLVTNVVFYNSDSGEFMFDLAKKKEKIDVVFMDPPRTGSDDKFLSSLCKLSPKKIVYISCNPVTLANDLEYLTANNYLVSNIQPVDMFPQTNHVECIVILEKESK